MRKVKKQKLTKESCRSIPTARGWNPMQVESETATPKETAQQIYDDLKNGADWDTIIDKYFVEMTSNKTAEHNNKIIRELNKLYPNNYYKFAEYNTLIFT